MAMKEMLENYLRPIRQRVMMMVSRGVLESTDDSQGVQTAKVSALAGETLEAVERPQRFGFSSRPPADSEVVLLFVGGNREHGFVIADEDRVNRMKDLLDGEVVLYTAETDHRVGLRQGGKIEIKNSSVELVDAFSQTLEALAAEPFIVNKATFSALKTLIDTMKV